MVAGGWHPPTDRIGLLQSRPLQRGWCVSTVCHGLLRVSTQPVDGTLCVRHAYEYGLKIGSFIITSNPLCAIHIQYVSSICDGLLLYCHDKKILVSVSQ